MNTYIGISLLIISMVISIIFIFILLFLIYKILKKYSKLMHDIKELQFENNFLKYMSEKNTLDGIRHKNVDYKSIFPFKASCYIDEYIKIGDRTTCISKKNKRYFKIKYFSNGEVMLVNDNGHPLFISQIVKNSKYSGE